jgi:hypothetical protein
MPAAIRRLFAALGAVIGAFVALPLPGVAQPPSAVPSWTVAIDSRDKPGVWLAAAKNVAFPTRDALLIAVDLRSGRTIWTSSIVPANHVVVGARRLFVPVADGYLVVDPSTGTVLARRAIGAGVELAGAGATVVVHQGTALRGMNEDGRTLWSRDLPVAARFMQPLGGRAVGFFDLTRGAMLVLDAASGNAVADVDGVNELVGADGRFLWFTVIGGGLKGIDLTTDRSIVVHDSIVNGAARVEHGIAVAVIGGRLSLLDLRGSRDPQALRIVGRWVGGPAGGTIFVERGDGLYAQRIDSTRATRVAAYRGQARLITSDGKIAFVGLADGRVFTFDVARARLLAQVQTSCHFYEGFKQTGAATLVHCDDLGARSQLVGLPRVAAYGDLHG